MKKIKELFFKYKEQILYVFFGGCTTVINYIIYFGMMYGFKMSAVSANAIAWLGAVIFAYVTNKIWVFENKTNGLKEISKEIASFLSARIATLLMEEVILFVFVDTMHLNNVIIKLLSQVLVVVANYFLSKFFVFKKEK